MRGKVRTVRVMIEVSDDAGGESPYSRERTVHAGGAGVAALISDLSAWLADEFDDHPLRLIALAVTGTIAKTSVAHPVDDSVVELYDAAARMSGFRDGRHATRAAANHFRDDPPPFPEPGRN